MLCVVTYSVKWLLVIFCRDVLIFSDGTKNDTNHNQAPRITARTSNDERMGMTFAHLQSGDIVTVTESGFQPDDFEVAHVSGSQIVNDLLPNVARR